MKKLRAVKWTDGGEDRSQARSSPLHSLHCDSPPIKPPRFEPLSFFSRAFPPRCLVVRCFLRWFLCSVCARVLLLFARALLLSARVLLLLLLLLLLACLRACCC